MFLTCRVDFELLFRLTKPKNFPKNFETSKFGAGGNPIFAIIKNKHDFILFNDYCVVWIVDKTRIEKRDQNHQKPIFMFLTFKANS